MDSFHSLITTSRWDTFVGHLAVCKCSCPLHPHSWFRLVRDLLGLALVVYDTITIPLVVLVLPENGPEFDFLNSLSAAINAFWALDLLLTFNTGTYINGKLCMKYRLITKQYASTWLLPDFIMVFSQAAALFLDSR